LTYKVYYIHLMMNSAFHALLIYDLSSIPDCPRYCFFIILF
jgi:hypothetical protein